MWKKIYINATNIKYQTDKAILVNMPNKSDYKGYSFWFPIKLVKEENGKGYHISLSFTEDFIFCLKKYGKTKNNKWDVIKQYTISSAELMEQFDNTIKNNVEKEQYITEVSYLEVVEPKKVQNVDVLLKKELLNE